MNLGGGSATLLPGRPPDRPAALFAGVEPLEVFAELLADIDSDTTSTAFYDRICEAVCRLTTMRRAAIFIADVARRRVRPVGVHGTSFAQLRSLRPTLADTPIAQRALLEDEVVVVSERIEDAVPAEIADVLGITTLVCTPMNAAGRGYGVICADRGGGRFELTDGERHLLWTLGKTAALVATARNSTRLEERSRRLADRIELAREIHEGVLARLFEVSRALSGPHPLPEGHRERSRMKLQEAIGGLRRVLELPLSPRVRELVPVLSTREREVLELVSVGATNREIGARLHLSPHTVKEHTSSVYRKLQARNRAEAVQRAQRLGVLG